MTSEELNEALENLSALPDVFTREERDELIRLARIGIWAEVHAIPALRDFINNDPNGRADWALSELSKL